MLKHLKAVFHKGDSVDKEKQQLMKQAVARAAVEELGQDDVVGVGTGTTVQCFIEALADASSNIEGAVASSEDTARRLKAAGIPVLDLNDVGGVPIYIDGADEFNRFGYLTKGGGGALTREKIIAASARKFVCMVDQYKEVEILGAFPLPVAVIPMARSYVARQIVAMGGDPVYREGCVTDDGLVILDIHGCQFIDAVDWSSKLNQIPGVVTHGLFIKERADVLLVGLEAGVDRLTV